MTIVEQTTTMLAADKGTRCHHEVDCMGINKYMPSVPLNHMVSRSYSTDSQRGGKTCACNATFRCPIRKAIYYGGRGVCVCTPHFFGVSDIGYARGSESGH